MYAISRQFCVQTHHSILTAMYSMNELQWEKVGLLTKYPHYTFSMLLSTACRIHPSTNKGIVSMVLAGNN